MTRYFYMLPDGRGVLPTGLDVYPRDGVLIVRVDWSYLWARSMDSYRPLPAPPRCDRMVYTFTSSSPLPHPLYKSHPYQV